MSPNWTKHLALGGQLNVRMKQIYSEIVEDLLNIPERQFKLQDRARIEPPVPRIFGCQATGTNHYTINAMKCIDSMCPSPNLGSLSGLWHRPRYVLADILAGWDQA